MTDVQKRIFEELHLPESAAPLAHAIGEMLTAAVRLTLTAAESAHALDLPHEAKRMESAARALKRAQTPWDGLT